MAGDGKLEAGWRPASSELRAPGGGRTPFTDAVLVVRNLGPDRLDAVRVLLTVRQGEALLCEKRDAGVGGQGLGPGESVSAGALQLLQDVDPGLASRVHLFGVKALLNWRFSVLAEVSGRAGAEPSAARSAFAFHWAPDGSAGGAVALVEDPVGPAV